MSHGSYGNGQQAYPYVMDETYMFDDTGNRYLQPSSSNYYYPQVAMASQGSQVPRSMHQQPPISPTQQSFATVHDPRFVAQTNQTMSALASARRAPGDYRVDPNSQLHDAMRGNQQYYSVPQRDYSQTSMYIPAAQTPVVPRTPSSPTTLSPILKTNEGHACSYCGKTFGRPSAVKIHMAIHTGERAFTCPAPGCHRSFSVRSNMSRHIRNVHQSWPCENDGDFEPNHEAQDEIDTVERY